MILKPNFKIKTFSENKTVRRQAAMVACRSCTRADSASMLEVLTELTEAAGESMKEGQLEAKIYKVLPKLR